MSRRKQQSWQGAQLEDATVGQKADQGFTWRGQRQAGEVQGVKRRCRIGAETLSHRYLRHSMCSSTSEYPEISILLQNLDTQERSGSSASYALEHVREPLHARVGKTCVRI
jgi:hypothetical protein